LRDEEGRRLVTRNGYHREREIQTGIGGITIKQPRVDSRKSEAKFNSQILPKYIRRTESIDAFIPLLYLNGLSTGDFVINTFEDKYSKAVMCLRKDEEKLLTFYDFPAAHFQHFRTTNPIESSFSTEKQRLR